MKTILYLTLIALVIVFGILGVMYVLNNISIDEFKDYGTKSGAVILIVAVVALLVRLLVKGKTAQ